MPERINVKAPFGFVALSRFTVANGVEQQVKEAFRNRPHLVENASGFLRLDVLSPLENQNEIWLLTYWDSEASFQAWHASHAFQKAHRALPKGVKLDPKATRLTFLEHIAS
jgi:heme-degrading monooxygenase HmoA